MLSARGEAYARAGLANGYLVRPRLAFNKDTNRDGVVSFGNAENFLMQDIMLEYIRSKAMTVLDSASLTYNEGPFGSQRLRTAMAHLINVYFRPIHPVDAADIVFTNGVTSLNAICAQCLTNPDCNQGILLGQPIYGSFAGDLSVPSGCQLIYTPFHAQDQFANAVAVVACYERALQHATEAGVAVKALVICNPHNPLGRCYPRKTLEALMQFCQKYRIHLVCDEIYALSVYGGCDADAEESGNAFVSILSIDPVSVGVDPDRIHVLYGMSKDFSMAGLRLGCLITRNEDFLRAALSMSIATTVLEDHDFVHTALQQSRRLLKEHHDLATRILDEGGIPYSKNSVAGFFLWIDLSECLDPAILTTEQDGGWAAEQDLSRRLNEDIGVEMASGRAYRSETPGWFRVIFTVEKEALKEALSRIVKLYLACKASQLA